MHSTPTARLIMEAVAILHQRGYGGLKLFCYVKQGLGAWRHGLFAANGFAGVSLETLPIQGSLPSDPIACGETAEEVADNIEEGYPEFLQTACNHDLAYVEWYAQLLANHPQGALEMETNSAAFIRGVRVEPPYKVSSFYARYRTK